MNKKILVIDIETTGFHPREAIITEVGIVELDLETGERQLIFDEVCWNRRDFLNEDYISNSWVVKKGYMTTEEIRNGRDFDSIKKDIQEIIDYYPNGATAYNRIFDITFLEYYGITFPKLLPCPMILSTGICKIPFNNPRQRGLNYKRPNVEEAYAFFFPEATYNEIHRGGDDAMHEAEIVYKLYELNQFTL